MSEEWSSSDVSFRIQTALVETGDFTLGAKFRMG